MQMPMLIIPAIQLLRGCIYRASLRFAYILARPQVTAKPQSSPTGGMSQQKSHDRITDGRVDSLCQRATSLPTSVRSRGGDVSVASTELSITTSAYITFWSSGICAARRDSASSSVNPFSRSRRSMRLRCCSGSLEKDSWAVS